jgi:hypothetical protein
MDTLIALGMEISMNENNPMNPLYPIPGENLPIFSTGLATSMASEKFLHDNAKAVAIDYIDPPFTPHSPLYRVLYSIVCSVKSSSSLLKWNPHEVKVPTKVMTEGSSSKKGG